jgi:hypothetical protein
VQYGVELLEQLRAAGVVPGAKASQSRSARSCSPCRRNDGGLRVAAEVAIHVCVRNLTTR